MRSREERPKKPDRHGKGKIIIMWLLFMPLLAIGVTCLVNTFNVNAKNEENIKYKFNTNVVNSANDLIEGNLYKYTITKSLENSTPLIATKNLINYYIYATKMSITELNFGNNNNYFRLQFNNNRYELQMNANGWTWLDTTNNNNNIEYPFYFYFTYNSKFYNENFTLNISNVSEADYIPIEEINQKDLSNIFYYSVYKVEQSPLFNWASNNIIYTGMHNMCTTMNITSTFIPFILTYWILTSIIYMLFDIEFTLLWKLHEKIHDLTESL